MAAISPAINNAPRTDSLGGSAQTGLDCAAYDELPVIYG